VTADYCWRVYSVVDVQNVLAKKVIAAVPSVEMVRFCNSGTEACMGALRLMRAYTGRNQILKFEGCYHGHADPFLVQAGSGVATLGLPDSPGVPKGATAGTLCAPYNNLEAVKKIFEENPESIAGIILEPVRVHASATFTQGTWEGCLYLQPYSLCPSSLMFSVRCA